MSGDVVQLNNRERATLRAVGVGRAEITCSAEPDLFIDGLARCDQVTAHRLAHLCLIVPSACRTDRRTSAGAAHPPPPARCLN